MTAEQIVGFNFHFLLFALALSVTIVIVFLHEQGLESFLHPIYQAIYIFVFFELLYWVIRFLYFRLLWVLSTIP